MDIAAILVESYAIDAIWSVATVICFVLTPSVALVFLESWIQIKVGLFITSLHLKSSFILYLSRLSLFYS